MSEMLVVDELKFEVRRSARRRSMQLTVDRGGELRIFAPAKVGLERLDRFVRENRFWLYTKLAEKGQRSQPGEGKRFVSGEGFPYLGRSYRLRLVEQQDAPLKLVGGRFVMRRDLASRGREEFVRWYSDRALQWLRHRVAGWAERMGAQPADLGVRDLGFRWGSCGKGGRLNFHWAVILLPAVIVDYVIVHELAHLLEPNHLPGFWRRVARAMPDYEERRLWLASRGGGVTGL